MAGSAITHFEIHVGDAERAKKFYSELFGWGIENANVPGADYWLISTGRTTGQDGKQVGIDGGMVQRSGDQAAANAAPNASVLTIEVADVEATAAKAIELGATKTTDKMDIPGVGQWYGLKDTEGNHLGILQPTS